MNGSQIKRYLRYSGSRQKSYQTPTQVFLLNTVDIIQIPLPLLEPILSESPDVTRIPHPLFDPQKISFPADQITLNQIRQNPNSTDDFHHRSIKKVTSH